jgi:hypothetical protein
LQSSQEQFNFRNSRGCPHFQSPHSLRENTHQGLVNQSWDFSNPPQCPSYSLPHSTPSDNSTGAGLIFSETPVPSPLAAIFQEAILEMDAQSGLGQTNDAGTFDTNVLNHADENINTGEVANDDPPPPYSLEA